jgi:hypothetical protein
VTGPREVLDRLGVAPGERATLLQFSSAFCAPVPRDPAHAADVAALVPGVVHVEVDADEHLDLTRRLGIDSTPTTLVLDADGAEARARAVSRARPRCWPRWPGRYPRDHAARAGQASRGGLLPRRQLPVSVSLT